MPVRSRVLAPAALLKRAFRRNSCPTVPDTK
jgi:hypothetical protein